MAHLTDILEANIKYLSFSDYNQNAIKAILEYDCNCISKYQLKKNSNDEYYLLYENKPVTSSYATQKEAIRLIENTITNDMKMETIAIFFSCSYPMHIKHFSENYRHKTIFLIEKDISLLYLILSSIRLEFLSKTILLVGESDSLVASVVDTFVEDVDVKKICICAHPRATTVDVTSRTYYSNISIAINEILKKKIMSLATYYYHAPLWSKNILYNIMHNQGYSIKSFVPLKNNNIPVLIVSAGSTIDGQIENIKLLSKSHFTLVLSNALRFMVANNIKIDAIISTDGGFYASYHYMALEYASQNNINIITTYSSYPYANTLASKTNIFYFSHNELFEKYYCKNSYYMPMQGSVSIIAYNVARLFASNSIVIAGADFSFTDEQTHSKYSMSSITDYTIQNKLNSLYSLNENRQGSDKIYIDDYKGRKKSTSFTLYEYHKHFEHAVNTNSSNIKVYSLTDFSAKVKNVDLYEIKNNYKKLEYSIKKIDEPIDRCFVDKDIKSYFSMLDKSKIEDIINHPYSMLIAPWHVENCLKNNKDSSDELFSFINTWRKSVSIFL